MKSISAKEAKNGFGLLLDTARAEPVTIEKHGRAVVVVISVEEYERLSAQEGCKVLEVANKQTTASGRAANDRRRADNR